MSAWGYDAVLLIAFGGPTCMEDVRPFLANVLRGRPVPPERIESVVHHYELIGGRSPLNDLTFRQARRLASALRDDGLALPVYTGMRNWTPYLHETLADMRDAGVRRAIGLILSPQQNDAGWDRYVRDVAAAREQVGADAPEIDFAGEWHAHPLFLDAASCQVAQALARVPEAGRSAAPLVFTAHSIPTAMAAASPYVAQLEEAAAAIAVRVGHERWLLAYQSRSGSPREPWLEPDICDVIRQLGAAGASDVVIAPIGFVCDHVEVLYDLDVEARQAASAAGIRMQRASTVNDHAAFIRMLADVVEAKAGFRPRG